MKLSLRLILFLAFGVTIVTFWMARNEVRSEKRGLRADLERRAELVAESIQEVVEPILEKGSPSELQPVLDRLGERNRLAGVAVYDNSGRVLAEFLRLEADFDSLAPTIAQAREQNRAFGQFSTLNDTPVHIFYQPLRRGPIVAGVLVVFHDAGSVEAQSARIWRGALWHGIVQVLVIVAITILMIRWTIVSPLAKTAQWMRELRAGRITPRPRLSDEGIFKPLSQEVANLAQSLAEARAAAKEEARLRDTGESLWTAERLRVSMRSKLNGCPLFVVSNREPCEHVHRGKGIEAVVPASGLVTALEPILSACDGTWIAHGSGDADREVVDQRGRMRMPLDRPRYTLRRVWLTEEEVAGYYLGFANEGIWPLCHIAHTRPVFRAEDWRQYQRVNEKFAQVLLEELEGTTQPIVLIQDYHFALLPRLVKEKRPDAKVAIFWHIPWPNPEATGICPWQGEVLNGLLGADLVGFHLQSHCNNFLETVDRAVESRIDWERFAVNREGHITIVRPHPISVAFPEEGGQFPADGSRSAYRAALLKTLGIEDGFLGVGVDRMDYTKGLIERFQAIGAFLQDNPQYRQRFTFVQIGAPSRTQLKRYQDLAIEIEREAAQVNQRFATKNWKPIVLLSRHHSHEEIAPIYKAADFCFVTSLHDGMNLVAKEFVAARDDGGGALILSRFAGACHELRDAIVVNPYDIGQMAEAIRFAIEMTDEQRRLRMQRMRQTVREHNVYRWAAELISELVEIRLDLAETVAGVRETAPASPPEVTERQDL
jgi:trehalose-6-phosphate synthase